MSRSATQIQGTSDSCTLSKTSIAQRGYTTDPFVSCFVNKFPRRAPLINMGYFVRARVVNDAIESFLKFMGGTSAQIVSCGAGFDSNYFALSASKKIGSDFTYVEIDYPEVVERKMNSINNSPSLKTLVGPLGSSCQGINGRNYKLIACDMEKESDLFKRFSDYGINFLLPTMFISECAITYMKEEGSSNLIEWASRNFKDAAFVTYEQILPYDGFGLVMVNHFQKLHSPLQSIEKFPTLRCQKERYLNLGWSSCCAASVLDIYLQNASKEEQSRVLSLEPFDEYEEWHAKCCHYSLSVATKGVLVQWNHLSNVTPPISSTPPFECGWSLVKSNFRRYNHASCQIGDNEFLVIGGFGPLENGGNTRLPTISHVIIKDSQEVLFSQLPLEAPPGIKFSRVHHFCEVLTCGKVLVFGGRTSPLNPLSDCVMLSINRDNSGNIKCVAVDQLHFPAQVTPPPRWRFSGVIVPDGNDEALMVFGGRGSCLETLGDLWCLSLKSFTWKKEDTSNGPGPRFSHSAALWEKGQQVIISGGLVENGYGYPLNEIWSLHHVSKKWTQLKCCESSPHIPLDRYGHGSAVVDIGGHDCLIMVGGISGFSGLQPGIGVFNLRDMKAMEYSLPFPSPESPLMTFNHSIHISPDRNEIIILGGGGTCFSFGTSFNNQIIRIDIQQLLKSFDE
ncbi:tRNA wybutosine-synthesizing protein 4-like [Ischnura elegans]|uniref:tRNA wybutosine-synthesizing protein 4-like n=1 Tax=Ischnura elegans TaxID=197161 RepID=UPI001ED8B460|nr:tRNA wybutosine-synthesizing protein 4-like [Ischnura elegans]